MRMRPSAANPWDHQPPKSMFDSAIDRWLINSQRPKTGMARMSSTAKMRISVSTLVLRARVATPQILKAKRQRKENYAAI